MVRNLIRNQAPGNRLRVRIPCPPLRELAITGENRLFWCFFLGELASCVLPACSLRRRIYHTVFGLAASESASDLLQTRRPFESARQ